MSRYIPDNAEVTMFYQQFTEALMMAAIDERRAFVEHLIANKVLRVDALDSLVFVNCDTLEVEYLAEPEIKGELK